MDNRETYPPMRWLMLVATCIAACALQSNMLSFAPLLGEIAKHLRVNPGVATHFMTIFMLPSPIALIVGGILCDRFGVKKLVMLCACGASISASVMPWIGDNFTLIMISRFLQGMFSAFLLAAPGPIMAIWFSPKDRGMVGGLIMAAVSLGGVFGLLVAPALFYAVGSWQMTSLLLTIPAWLAFFITTFVPAQAGLSGPIPTMEGQADTGFRQAVMKPATWIGMAIVFFSMWCMQGLMNMIPSYLAVDKPTGLGFGPLLSGKVSMTLAVSGIFAPIIGGIMLDKVFKGVSRPLLLTGFLLVLFCAYPVLISSVISSIMLLSIFLVLAGAGASMTNPGVTAFVAATYPPHIVGKVMGLWMGVGSFGAVIGMFVSGLLVAHFGNYTMAITLISISAVVGCLFAFFLSPPKKVLATVNVKGEAS